MLVLLTLSPAGRRGVGGYAGDKIPNPALLLPAMFTTCSPCRRALLKWVSKIPFRAHCIHKLHRRYRFIERHYVAFVAALTREIAERQVNVFDGSNRTLTNDITQAFDAGQESHPYGFHEKKVEVASALHQPSLTRQCI